MTRAATNQRRRRLHAVARCCVSPPYRPPLEFVVQAVHQEHVGEVVAQKLEQLEGWLPGSAVFVLGHFRVGIVSGNDH